MLNTTLLKYYVGDVKMNIVGELSEEIKKMHRNEMDPIVHGYLQTLIISKDK